MKNIYIKTMLAKFYNYNFQGLSTKKILKRKKHFLKSTKKLNIKKPSNLAVQVGLRNKKIWRNKKCLTKKK